MNGRRYFEWLIEDGPLPRQPDITRPFDEMGEVSLLLDVLLSAKFLGIFFNERIHYVFGLLFLYNGRCLGHLLPLGLLYFGHLAWLEERKPCFLGAFCLYLSTLILELVFPNIQLRMSCDVLIFF